MSILSSKLSSVLSLHLSYLMGFDNMSKFKHSFIYLLLSKCKKLVYFDFMQLMVLLGHRIEFFLKIEILNDVDVLCLLFHSIRALFLNVTEIENTCQFVCQIVLFCCITHSSLSLRNSS